MIYLDNAATSGKKPQCVINAVHNALLNFSANPGRGGHKMSINTALAVYDVRKKLSDFFGASGAQNVVFCANCTTALNFVIKGTLQKNDHVIISDLEHNAVLRPLAKTVDEYSKAEVSFTDDWETVENFRNLIKENTKMVICTSASNVTGKILPLKAIGRLCREKNILFAVDGAQGGGIIPINMKEMYIDYLCLAAHKGLYAPMGTGVLIAEKPIANTVIEGGNGIESLNPVQSPFLPEGFESGTISVPNILSIGAGIDFINRVGMGKIYSDEMKIIAYCYEKMTENKRIILYTPYPEKYNFAPVVSFNIENKSSEDVAMFLDQNNIAVRGGFHCSLCAHERLNTTDTGTVRISPCIFNCKDEINYLLKIVKKI